MDLLARASHFRVQFSSHQEAKNAVETINSATEYPIDVGFEYAIRLPLIADYAPPPPAQNAGTPSRTIMVKMYGGELQAVVNTFEKHATVVSSREPFLPIFYFFLCFLILILQVNQLRTATESPHRISLLLSIVYKMPRRC